MPSTGRKPTDPDDTRSLSTGRKLESNSASEVIRQLERRQRQRHLHMQHLRVPVNSARTMNGSALAPNALNSPVSETLIEADPRAAGGDKGWDGAAQVSMAVTEGLMSVRLDARPGPQIHRERVRRYTACIN